MGGGVGVRFGVGVGGLAVLVVDRDVVLKLAIVCQDACRCHAAEGGGGGGEQLHDEGGHALVYAFKEDAVHQQFRADETGVFGVFELGGD